MEWIYSAVVVAIMAGFFGIGVGVLVLRRVMRTGDRPKPVVTWLLGAMTAMSVVQVLEQTRVLAFRLAFDGFIGDSWFLYIYRQAWNVSASKVLAAVSLTISSAVMLGLYLDLDERSIVRWGAAAGCIAMAVWVTLAIILDGVLP